MLGEGVGWEAMGRVSSVREREDVYVFLNRVVWGRKFTFSK